MPGLNASELLRVDDDQRRQTAGTANSYNLSDCTSRIRISSRLTQAGRQRRILRGRHDDLDRAENGSDLQPQPRNRAVAGVPLLARVARGCRRVRGLSRWIRSPATVRRLRLYVERPDNRGDRPGLFHGRPTRQTIAIFKSFHDIVSVKNRPRLGLNQRGDDGDDATSFPPLTTVKKQYRRRRCLAGEWTSLKEEKVAGIHHRARAKLRSVKERLAYDLGRSAAVLGKVPPADSLLSAETILQGLYEFVEQGELEVGQANQVVQALTAIAKKEIESQPAKSRARRSGNKS